MIVSGSFHVPTDKESVYRMFTNVEKLTTCVPGVDQLRVLGDNRYEAEMTVKIQFMTIKFAVNGELTEEIPGQKLLVQMSGQPAKLAGLFQNRLTANFAEVEPRLTEVTYSMEVRMSGRLASLGEILIKSTIEKSAKQFVGNVNQLFQ